MFPYNNIFPIGERYTLTSTTHTEMFEKYMKTESSFDIKMVDMDDSYEPLQYEELPQEYQLELDELASELFDRDLGKVIIVGSTQAGKTFFIHQFVGNVERYLNKLHLSRMNFIRLMPEDLELIMSFPNRYTDYISCVTQQLRCSERDICFVTEDPAIAAKIKNFTSKARIILEASSATFLGMINNESQGNTKIWSSWGVVEIDSILLKKKELVNLIHQSLHDRIQSNFNIDLTSKTVATFVNHVLKEIPELMNEDKTINVPLGVWMIALRRMCGVLGLSESAGLYHNNKIVLSRVIHNIVEDHRSRFEVYAEDDTETILIHTPFGSFQETLANVLMKDSDDSEESDSQVPFEKLVFNNMNDVNKALKSEVLGQDESIDALTDGLIVPAANLHDDSKPLRSLLFLGPTGVGKTKLATTLAKTVSKTPMNILRIDMSEYSQSHEAAKLLGAPPGYAGFESGGVLTNAVKKNPHSLILLDEIEKAHPKIWDSFLQILDAGRMTDGQGNTIDFTQTIIIMTSNIGAKDLTTKAMGFSFMNDEDVFTQRQKDARKIVMAAVEKDFRPEFINRIDEVIVFKELSTETARDIVHKELNIVSERMAKNGFTLKEVSNDIIDELLIKSNVSKYGARDIQRVILKNISHLIAKEMVSQNSGSRDFIELTLDADKNIIITQNG